MHKKISFLTFLIFWSSFIMANPVDDFFRSMGKMYTVFGVIALIFIGLVVFLFRMEKRISKLEKD